MDVDVKVLQEIAQDKARVADVDWWLKQDDKVGKSVCPISRHTSIGTVSSVDCKSLCWKLWPGLGITRAKPHGDSCPCNNGKPVRDVFQAISALSKLVLEPERLYKRGDVFRVGNAHGYSFFVMLAQIGSNEIEAMSLDGNRLSDRKITPTKEGDVSREMLVELFGNNEYVYIGNMEEITIVNSKVQ